MTTTNLFKRLQQLLPSDPVLTGTVTAVDFGGMATVELPGGGQLRVRNPLGHELGNAVYVQGQAITGDAPQLPYVRIEI